MMTAYITGDTYEYRDRLRAAGYRWDAQQKAWARDYNETISPDEALRDVRHVPGIRNRGEFRADVE